MSMRASAPNLTPLERLQQDLERGTGDLPVLPRAAEQALQIAQSADVNYDHVVEVAESDPALAARFLGVANSAFYFRGVPINSIRRAVVRLGTQATRDVLYMAVYSGVFNSTRYKDLVEAVFHHCMVTARTGRRLAELLDRDPETAFLSGLLHDVGRARCLKLAARRPIQANQEQEMLAAIDTLHMQAGTALALAWRLPEEVIEACEFHHTPEDRPMAKLIFASDTINHFCELKPRATEDEVVAALDALGIKKDKAPMLIEAAKQDAILLKQKMPR